MESLPAAPVLPLFPIRAPERGCLRHHADALSPSHLRALIESHPRRKRWAYGASPMEEGSRNVPKVRERVDHVSPQVDCFPAVVQMSKSTTTMATRSEIQQKGLRSIANTEQHIQSMALSRPMADLGAEKEKYCGSIGVDPASPAARPYRLVIFQITLKIAPVAGQE